MKRFILLFLPLLLCLSGCGKKVIEEPAPLASPVAQARILIPADSDSIVREACEHFAEQLADALGTNFTVERVHNLKQSLSSQGAVLAFAAGGWNGSKDLFSCPFLFNGYEHFSMAANSRAVLEEAGKSAIGYKSLAAFYTGSSFLLSTINLDDYTSFRGMIIDAEDRPEPGTIPTVAMAGDSAARRSAYEKAGAVVVVEAGAEERHNRLMRDEIEVAEFSFAEAGLLGGDGPDMVFLTRSWQDIKCLWLFCDAEWLDSLAPVQDALLREKMAALFPAIDGAYLEREEKALAALEQWAYTPSRDFTDTRLTLRGDAMSALPAQDAERRRIMALIEGIG